MKKLAPYMMVLITIAVLGLLVYELVENKGSTRLRLALVVLVALLTLGWIFAGLNLKKGSARVKAGEWVEAEATAEAVDEKEPKS